jgi:hypothetical protein
MFQEYPHLDNAHVAAMRAGTGNPHGYTAGGSSPTEVTTKAILEMAATMMTKERGLTTHLRQDKLYIRENEGILHAVQISPAADRRTSYAVAPDRCRYAL